MTVASPPIRPGDLERFPAKLLSADFAYSRIHHVSHEAEWFCADRHCRFDPRAGSAFGTCYLAGNPLGAYMEKFGRLRLTTRALVDQQTLTRLQLCSSMRVADLTDRTILGGWQLDAEIWAGSDYEGCQRWASALFDAGFAGLWYPSRRSVDGELHLLAVFGEQGWRPDAFRVVGSGPVPDDLVADAEERFGLTVLPGVPISDE